jgi:hypothetical protein
MQGCERRQRKHGACNGSTSGNGADVADDAKQLTVDEDDRNATER